MTSLLRILALWRGRAGPLLIGALISVAAALVGVALLSLAGGVVAATLLGGVLVSGALAGLGPARVILRYTERLLTHDATFRALADLRVWFFRGVARRSAAGLGFSRTGDTLARLVDDIATLDGVYLRVLLPLLAGLVLLPVLIATLAPRSVATALAASALFVLAAFVLPVLAARATRAGGARLGAATGALRISVLDLVSGLREVRAFGAEDRLLAAVQAREGAVLAEQGRLATAAALAGAAAFLCAQAGIVLVLAQTHQAAAAVISVFLTVAVFEAIGGLPRAGALAGYAAASADRVLRAATAPAAIPDPAQPALLPSGSALRFEGVGFRWQPDRPAVFDGLTLDIPQGTRAAILGPSGSGKSTLVSLAMKLAVPQLGSVSLGGVNLATLRAEDVRTRFAWLGQTTHLFDDTVRGNLRIGRPDAEDSALWIALEQAQLADVVRALPDGLDTWLGEAGAALSGGEGRRLALARALLSTAPILILDEPAAGLDAPTERAFLSTLNAVAEGRTVLLIVHRLTGAERLDRIYRLSAGRAVAATG